MADETLQAFQLGASLYDRAQTQKRMMEQMQMQTADQLMRQRQYDLQNKIQSNAYAQALAEQEAQAAEYDTFQKFNEDVGTYFNDPDLKAPMPALPRFRSKVFNQEATRAYQGLQQYSPRAKIIKAREQFDKLRADSIEEMQNQGIDVFDPQTGQVNEEVYRTNLPVIREQLKEKEIIGKLSPEIFTQVSLLDKKIPIQERIKKAQDIVDQRKIEQLSPSERAKMRLSERAVSEYESLFGKPDQTTKDIIESNALSNKWNWPDGKAEARITGDETIASISGDLVKSLDDFEKNYGPKTIQKYVGIIDGRVSDIEKRLSGAKTDEERDAYALLQRFQQQFNKTAFETSGKAVTQPEMQRLVAALGNVKSNNFANDVRNFAKMSAEDLHRTIKSFKDQYRIRPEQVRLANDLIKQFNLPLTPFGQQRQSAPAGSTGTAPSLPAGVTPFTGSTNVSSGFIYTP
jgi:hypothetical protein